MVHLLVAVAAPIAIAIAIALTACGPSNPAVNGAPAPGSMGPERTGVAAKPPAPAFKQGMVVSDRTGTRVGVVQTVTETPGGLNVVVEIEGKLVGVEPSTLQLQGETAVSSQTKAEILAAAGAPR